MGAFFIRLKAKELKIEGPEWALKHGKDGRKEWSKRVGIGMILLLNEIEKDCKRMTNLVYFCSIRISNFTDTDHA